MSSMSKVMHTDKTDFNATYVSHIQNINEDTIFSQIGKEQKNNR